MAFAAERERSEQLALVNAVMREIGGTLSPEHILQTAVRRIHEAFLYPVVAFSLAERDRGTYRITAAAMRDQAGLGGSLSLDQGIVGRTYREKKTQNVRVRRPWRISFTMIGLARSPSRSPRRSSASGTRGSDTVGAATVIAPLRVSPS